MLQKIKIGTRLALAFAVLLLLISALAAGGISGAKRLTERSAALYGDRTVPLGVLSEISHLTQRNRVLVMDMLMDPGTSNLEASHAALTANVERIQTLWKDYAAKPLGAEEQALAQAFAEADLIVCRAGASTVTEIASVGAAAVYVPFPAAVDDHQTTNARFLVDAGAGWLMPQSTLSAQGLAEMLQNMQRATLLERAELAKKMQKIDATEKVVAACEELVA